jgi:hypothetical protein
MQTRSERLPGTYSTRPTSFLDPGAFQDQPIQCFAGNMIFDLRSLFTSTVDNRNNVRKKRVLYGNVLYNFRSGKKDVHLRSQDLNNYGSLTNE